jgi:predicted porin
LYVDNGDQDDFFHVDNDNSSTRVRFVGTGALTEDITVGSQIEVQFESNSTASIRIDQDGSAGPNNFTERKLELYVDSKRFGRLWLGQGDTASNGTSEVDLSGTSVIAYSGTADMAGGIAFSDNNVLGPIIGDVFSNFDGLSRDDRIRYDTPSFSGFKGSVSTIEGGAVDAAIRFSGEIAGTKVVAATAWADASSKDANNFKQYNGSVSVLTPMGISVTGAVGTRDPDSGTGDDPLFYYAKLGYTFDAVSFGSTSVAIDYQAVDDLDQDGDEGQTYGAFMVQRYDKIGAELYLGARNHELDRPGSNFDDVLAVLVGGRVRF